MSSDSKADANWWFAEKGRAEKERDPIQGEFFNQEGMSAASSIVREAIQNALDAKAEKFTGPVRVRIYTSGSEGALAPGTADHFVGSLREHVMAVVDSEPRKQERLAALFGDSCRFLVIEDFNTCGLLGDVTESMEPAPDDVNHFYYFFRAEGRSGKRKSELGSWGIGKYVFPKASNVNSFFGLTVRQTADPGETGPYLMGQSVLKYHTLNDQRWSPDGYWAEDDDGLPVPLTDDQTLSDLRTTFAVTRTCEPGLSVVIPYADESLTFESIRDAVVTDFYAAIIEGRLEVTIDGSQYESVTLTIHTLYDALAALSSESRAALRADMALYLDAAAMKTEPPLVELPSPGGRPIWGPSSLTAEQRKIIRERLDIGKSATIRVPVTIVADGGEAKTTWFDLALARDEKAPGTPTFIRRGLIVTDAVRRRTPALKHYRAVIRIQEETMVAFLGDAEGPAHNDWTATREHFKSKGYLYGHSLIVYVLSAAKQILTFIREDEDTEDDLAAASYFPRHEDDGKNDNPSGDSGGSDDPDSTDDPPPPPPSNPRKFAITETPGGFNVTLTDDGRNVSILLIDVAYDRRRGNPFTKWSSADFDLAGTGKDDPKIELSGATAEIRPNQLKIAISDSNAFSAKVTGFDQQRDLIVRVTVGAAE